MADIIHRQSSKNLANGVTMLRIILVLAAVLLLDSSRAPERAAGLVFLISVFLLDGVDGFLARRFRSSNNVGALLDTLGDRIAENTVLVLLAYKRIIPLFVPLIFITRSFLADFVRSLAFKRGIGTFSVNASDMGYYLVASKVSRTVYLILKLIFFLFGACIIVAPDLKFSCFLIASGTLFCFSLVLVGVNLVRFLALLYDARLILKEEFSG